ncbi:hypothetical protein Lal_00031707 [Lupinus albus]|nr:hypothetical protein Lal_00043480 [Lupinus albus]KAF1891736.1 hypothetical protein Lal_00031707 [Lupinus albus]
MSHGWLKTESAVEGAVMDDRSCVLPPPALRLFDPWGSVGLLIREPQVRRGYPLSLSISISGGKETNKDSLTSSVADRAQVPWKGAPERVRAPSCPDPVAPRGAVGESGCLGMQPQSGGKFRPRLNTGERPIANKYREGKMKRTLKRESKSA